MLLPLFGQRAQTTRNFYFLSLHRIPKNFIALEKITRAKSQDSVVLLLCNQKQTNNEAAISYVKFPTKAKLCHAFVCGIEMLVRFHVPSRIFTETATLSLLEHHLKKLYYTRSEKKSAG